MVFFSLGARRLHVNNPVFTTILKVFLIFTSLAFIRPSIASEAVVGDITEVYTSDTPASGTVLVGIWAGLLGEDFLPENLHLVAPEKNSAYKVCFRATTRDGVYFASGLLEAPAGTKRNLPVEFYAKHNYLPQIRTYHPIDFAPLAYLSDNCKRAKNKTVIPISINEPDGSLTLVINSRGSWIHSITVNDGREFFGRDHCSSDSSRRNTSYDVLCTITLSSFSQSTSSDYSIAIKRKPKNGSMRIDDILIRY